MLTSLRDRGPYKGWALGLQGTLQKWGGSLPARPQVQEVRHPSLDTGRIPRVSRPLEVAGGAASPRGSFWTSLHTGRPGTSLHPGSNALIGRPQKLTL